MSLIFMDGFEAGDVALKWDIVASFSSNTTTRFSSGRSIRTGSSGSAVSKTFTAASQVTVGAAVMGAPGIQLKGDSNATAHLTIMRNTSTGLLQLRRGTDTGTVIATGTTSIAETVWFYLEIRATIADSGGTAEVRLNGSSTPEINFTGDTKNGGTNTTIDTVQLTSVGSPTNGTYFDDCYVLNATGSSNTTFLGDVRVQTLVPDGNGTNSQLTGSDGNSVDNYQLVDELPYSTTDYAGSATSGNRDTYTLGNLISGTTQVFGVQTNMIAGKSDATAASAKSALLISGNYYYGATNALNSSFSHWRDIRDTNPDTSTTWTTSDVNGMEGGMEVV